MKNKGRIKCTLQPGAPGTDDCVKRYGKSLVCVRYRYDAKRNKRLKTVELVVDESFWDSSPAAMPSWNELNKHL